MPLQLPPHVAKAIEATDEDDRVAVAQRVRLLANPIGALLTDDARAYFESLLGNLPITSVIEVCDTSVETLEWRFRKVEFDGLGCAELLEIPDSSNLLLPPTDSEPLLVRAWLATDKLVDARNELRRNIAVFEWATTATDELKQVVRSLCGVQTGASPSLAERIWKPASSIEIRTNSRILRSSDGSLLRQMFAEAATELSLKWRFLSLYRILEHGYIENVFKELSDRFLSEPKEAVKDATTALGSEVEQLIRLVEAHRLRDHFQEVLRINDSLIASNNKFAFLVDREASKKSNYPEPYKRGVAIYYQIRCAIVHAGSYSVMLDRTPGGDDALVAHLPEIESAVLGFLGIVTT
jgi:hypothetical protein